MLLVGSLPQQVEVFAFPNSSGAPLSGQNPPLGSTANTFFSNSIGVYNSLMNVTAYGTQVLHTLMDMQVGFIWCESWVTCGESDVISIM